MKRKSSSQPSPQPPHCPLPRVSHCYQYLGYLCHLLNVSFKKAFCLNYIKISSAMKLLYTFFKESLSFSSILFDQHHLYSVDHPWVAGSPSLGFHGLLVTLFTLWAQVTLLGHFEQQQLHEPGTGPAGWLAVLCWGPQENLSAPTQPPQQQKRMFRWEESSQSLKPIGSTFRAAIRQNKRRERESESESNLQSSHHIIK